MAPAHNSFGVVLMIAKLRTRSPAGERPSPSGGGPVPAMCGRARLSSDVQRGSSWSSRSRLIGRRSISREAGNVAPGVSNRQLLDEAEKAGISVQASQQKWVKTLSPVKYALQRLPTSPM
jgi:hypothetical protein